MKKIFSVFAILMFSGSAWADEEKGSFFGNFVNRVFSGTAVEQVAAPATGNHLSSQITNSMNAAPSTQTQYQGYQQNLYPNQAAPNYSQQQKINEELVRCVYIGATVGENTKFSHESVAAQDNARRAGKLLSGLNCNQILAPYSDVIKQVEHAMNTCAANDDCETPTINQAQANSGGVKK